MFVVTVGSCFGARGGFRELFISCSAVGSGSVCAGGGFVLGRGRHLATNRKAAKLELHATGVRSRLCAYSARFGAVRLGLGGSGFLHEFFDSLQGELDLVQGSGVAEAQVAFSEFAEAGSGQAGDSGFIQNAVGQLG